MGCEWNYVKYLYSYNKYFLKLLKLIKIFEIMMIFSTQWTIIVFLTTYHLYLYTIHPIYHNDCCQTFLQKNLKMCLLNKNFIILSLYSYKKNKIKWKKPKSIFHQHHCNNFQKYQNSASNLQTLFTHLDSTSHQYSYFFHSKHLFLFFFHIFSSKK